MLIIFKYQNEKKVYYNITTNTWEEIPKKATLIGDVDVAYKLRNDLRELSSDNISVRYLKEEYIYEIYALGSDLETYTQKLYTLKELNEKEKDSAVGSFCSYIMEKKDISIALWGINFIRKEYKYE